MLVCVVLTTSGKVTLSHFGEKPAEIVQHSRKRSVVVNLGSQVDCFRNEFSARATGPTGQIGDLPTGEGSIFRRISSVV
jgi:hypothetical protein